MSIRKVLGSLVKHEYSRQIFEKCTKCQSLRHIRQWKPSCSIRTDGRTVMTKVAVILRNFSNAPKINTKHKTPCGANISRF
jgi:hypothetical protein